MNHPDFLDRTTSIAHLQSFGAHWASEVADWRSTGEQGTEKKYAQSFWFDLLGCFGINAARRRLFERDAARASTGRHGWIDFFMTGVAIGEAKSLDADLTAAAVQVDDYLAGGVISNTEFPRYSILTNFSTLQIRKLDDENSTPPVVFDIVEIANHYDDLLFFVGLDSLSQAEQQKASIKAAEIMAKLYVAVLGNEEADEGVGDETPVAQEDEDAREAATSILMTRLLFLLYGDDAGLWERDLFHRWVEQETTAGSLGAQLFQLFSTLNTLPSRRSHAMGDLMAKFPYVNGSIFADTLMPEFFTPATREALLEACRFQWTSISVSVFGAMFQLVKSKEARREAGEHYTSEVNILKTIGPLFLNQYQEEADRLIRNKSTTLKEFDALLDDMASNIYCDPACGSGNFLNLAYARLREIETEIIVEKRRRFSSTGGDALTLFIETEQRLRISQFHGFEIGWWPAKIAETSMFLVDHQANQRLAKAIGLAPERLPITITAHIHHGNALRLDWREVLPLPKGTTFIFGNPPFVGQKEKTEEQTADMRHVWGTNYDGYLDYVTGWHKKATDLYRERSGEFAFVTTNSITQGQPVPALFGTIFDDSWIVKFAHRTFAWDSQAPGQAAVHCVIVGFTRDHAAMPRLWDYPHVKGEPVEQKVTQGINAYLIDGPNVLVSKRSNRRRLSPELPDIDSGSTAYDWGYLTVELEEIDEVHTDPIASKYIRLYLGGEELINSEKRWCLWLEAAEPSDIRNSPILRERVEAVRERRLESKRKSTFEAAATPHLFGEDRQPRVPYLGIPQTFAEGRLYFTAARLDAEVIANKKLFTAPDEDGFLFGVISSAMFMAWQRAVGGRLKSDPSFSSTVVWNNFPSPALSEKQRQEIIEGGKKVLAARELHPDRSLADHYNPLAMDPRLLGAHRNLDRAVDKAFGASSLLRSEKERLELLFAHYASLTT